jgi:hypothetical protein
MVHHLFHKTPDKPTFPDPRDVSPPLTPRKALAALGLLRLLVDSGVAEIYTAAGGPRADGLYFWNIWLNASVAPPGGKRIPLREWAANVVCRDDDDDGPQDGDCA